MTMKKAFQWDIARQIERVDFLIEWLPRYAEWGYEQVHLYIENAFAHPSLPGVGRPNAWSPRDMERFVAAARACGLSVTPVQSMMGHAEYLVKVPELRDLSELRESNGNPLSSGQLCPLHRWTLPTLDRVIRDLRPYCTENLLHCGLDESFDIGKCPACRADIERIGLDRHFANHVINVHELCRAHGLRMGMWADMLYYTPGAIPLLPKDIVAYDWYYYPFRKSPRIEFYNFKSVDLTGTLRRAGLDVFGCPNSGPFIHEPITPFLDRLRNMISWWDYGRRKDTQGFLVTSWSPNRTAIELNSWLDAAAAGLWLNPGERDPLRLLELGFERVHGRAGRRWARVAAKAERHQYAGYYRWQANADWARLGSLEPLAPIRAEAAHFDRLSQAAAQAPEPLRATLDLRRYIARRDRFIREGAALIARGRRARGAARGAAVRALDRLVRDFARELPGARRAATLMWRRSRDPKERSPNLDILEADRGRLRALTAFVRAARRDASALFRASPLFGRWQLLARVRNFAPALQGLLVQIRAADGAWADAHSLYALEFTADAGTPKADFRRRHAAPVDWDGRAPLELRVAVRGVGQLEVYDLLLTDGVRTLRPNVTGAEGGPVRRPRRATARALPGAVLGAPAPTSGFPPVNFAAPQAWVACRFDPVADPGPA